MSQTMNQAVSTRAWRTDIHAVALAIGSTRPKAGRGPASIETGTSPGVSSVPGPGEQLRRERLDAPGAGAFALAGPGTRRRLHQALDQMQHREPGRVVVDPIETLQQAQRMRLRQQIAG